MHKQCRNTPNETFNSKKLPIVQVSTLKLEEVAFQLAPTLNGEKTLCCELQLEKNLFLLTFQLQGSCRPGENGESATIPSPLTLYFTSTLMTSKAFS